MHKGPWSGRYGPMDNAGRPSRPRPFSHLLIVPPMQMHLTTEIRVTTEGLIGEILPSSGWRALSGISLARSRTTSYRRSRAGLELEDQLQLALQDG